MIQQFIAIPLESNKITHFYIFDQVIKIHLLKTCPHDSNYLNNIKNKFKLLN